MTTSIDTLALSSSASLNPPDITRLTTKSVEGTGAFDVLMYAVRQHLLEEYEADRITGDEYTKVYLGALQGAMQTAVQFLLNSQQEEKIQAEIALTRQQTVTELAQTDDTIPAGLGFNGDTSVEGIVAIQKDKLALEKDLVDSQVDQSAAEVALTGQKIISELSQTADDFSTALIAGYGLNPSGSLLGTFKTAKEKTLSEIDYTDQRILTEVALTNKSTAETAHITQSTATELQNTGRVASEKLYIDKKILTEDATIDKLVSETSYTDQRTATELVTVDKVIAETAYTVQRTAVELATIAKVAAETSYTDQRTATELVTKDRVIAETDLTEQKIVTELANTSNIKPATLGQITDTTSITGIMFSQRNKLDAEIDYTNQKTATELVTKDHVIAETGKAVAETAYTTQRTVTEVAEESRIIAETSKTNALKSKTDAETIFTEQQTVTELANTSDTKPTDLGVMTGLSSITGLVSVQKEKSEMEVTLLAQKANTELAQTADLVKTGDPYLNGSTTVAGVISKQKELYAAQTSGFARDAEQKLAKIMADTWNVSATQGVSTPNSSNQLYDASLGAVIKKAKEGIGVAGTS